MAKMVPKHTWFYVYFGQNEAKMAPKWGYLALQEPCLGGQKTPKKGVFWPSVHPAGLASGQAGGLARSRNCRSGTSAGCSDVHASGGAWLAWRPAMHGVRTHAHCTKHTHPTGQGSCTMSGYTHLCRPWPAMVGHGLLARNTPK